MKYRWIILVLCTFFFVVVISIASADADPKESLGPPSIDIAPANGMVAAGTGMKDWTPDSPGKIKFSIPEGATIKQVLLYWEGRMKPDPNYDTPGDSDILVNDTKVVGKPITPPTKFCCLASSSSFRADITNQGFVAPGDNVLELEGLEFTSIDNGAGVLVLYEDSGPDAEFKVFDGLDLAFRDWPEPRKSTVPQTFTFEASTEERQAQLFMFVSSVISDPLGPPRPSSIEVTIDDVKPPQKFSDVLGNSDGKEWDTLNLPITIPAGAERLTVQIFSRDDNKDPEDPEPPLPASLAWIAAGLMVPKDSTTPGLEVSKNCTPTDVFVGDGIDYEFIVSNTGDADLIDVVLEDSHLGRVAEIDSLPAKESRTIKETWIATEADVITNTAWATGTIASSLEPIESNRSTAECSVYELEVTKDAKTSYDRRYYWKCDKTVNGKKSLELTLFPDQVVSATYDVAVKPVYPPYVDSNWLVSGTISVTNPAPIDASLESVTDVISDLEIFHQYFPVIQKSGQSQNAVVDQNQLNHITLPGISVPVNCPSLTVPAKETLVCTYGPFKLSTGLKRTNTAYAALKNTVGGVISGTTVFSGTAPIDFASVEPELIDEEVTVTDELQGFLGTVTVEDAPRSFSYDHPLPFFSPEECSSKDIDERTKQVTNTATFITNDTNTSDQCGTKTIVNLSCISTASTGYEDLPIERNDWDYNDAFFKVSFDTKFSTSNDLEKFTFEFEQPVNISSYTHEFWIKPDAFNCGGTYSITRNKGHKDEEVETGMYEKGKDLLIIKDTGIDDDGPNTAKLVINFNVQSAGDCPLNLSDYKPFQTFHGEDLFYVPRLYVKNTGEWIEPGDTRMVGVPDIWQWPGERIGIWRVYPDVTPPPSKDVEEDPLKRVPTFSPFWWLNYTGP